MAFRNSSLTLNRETENVGFTTYSDVYRILKDNIDDSSEFYEIEPAIVEQVLIDSNNLPKIKQQNPLRDIPDWSFYGCIKARFIHSQSEGDLIDGFIKPLSSHLITYPLKGEVVNVTVHDGKLYYAPPLNLYGKVNMNRATGKGGEGLVLPQRTKYNRKIYSEQGDVSLNGRFGNGLRLGSDKEYMYPNIKITNRQSVPDIKVADEHFPHEQDINSDGSSIFVTSGELKEIESLEPSADSKRWPPLVAGNSMSGDMITLNSDKLVFNAKGDGKGNNSDIHIFAARNINLASNYEINIGAGGESGGAINLGDPDAINSVVKSNELEELLEGVFDSLEDFLSTLEKSSDPKQIGAAAKTLNEELGVLKQKQLPKISSKTVFIADDKEDLGTEVPNIQTEG
jgi:hypothetical protein